MKSSVWSGGGEGDDERGGGKSKYKLQPALLTYPSWWTAAAAKRRGKQKDALRPLTLALASCSSLFLTYTSWELALRVPQLLYFDDHGSLAGHSAACSSSSSRQVVGTLSPGRECCAGSLPLSRMAFPQPLQSYRSKVNDCKVTCFSVPPHNVTHLLDDKYVLLKLKVKIIKVNWSYFWEFNSPPHLNS